jgi:hypothetical protein
MLATATTIVFLLFATFRHGTSVIETRPGQPGQILQTDHRFIDRLLHCNRQFRLFFRLAQVNRC